MGNPVVHFEVIGSDTEQLIKFYSELFGWHIEHMPEMGYGMVDTHAGKGIGGGVGVVPDGAQYVTFYIGVDDVDATLKKIGKADGKTLVPKTEIPNVVTFAQFQDPAGNRVGLVWNDPAQQGGGVGSGTNPEVGWFEVLGTDPDALAKFYTSTFGWTTKRNQMGENYVYHEVDTKAGGQGSAGGIGGTMDGSPHCTVYAGVDDITKTLQRAEALGGKIVMPEMKVTEETIIGQFADPQGNVFGLYKRMPD